MTEKVTQATSNHLMASQLEEEASLIVVFLEMITAAKKTLIIKLRSGIGQLSACKVDHATPKDKPKKVYANSAWIGLKFPDKVNGPDFYRTETIGCRNAFMSWVRKKIVWLSEKIKKPDQAFKDLVTIFVPEEICFTLGFRFSIVDGK